MEFECMRWSCGKERKMEEQAKEELQMLEAQYPNHYEYLKLELKSFIFLLQSQQQQQDSQLALEQNNHCKSSMIDTQESTSQKQRKSSKQSFEPALEDRVVMKSFEPALEDRVVMKRKIDEGSENETSKTAIKHCSGKKAKKRDRVDVVLERAEACLKKIRHFKTSFLSPS